MTWRLATSLQVLLGQINTMFPDRDKRTDGAISGYPGSISGHNANADGVVCAFDFTTGDYPGGITLPQSYPLADAIRQELLIAPRGLYTYLIHHMEPPWVPAPGPYIAHGGPASLWQWIPYTGSDPHTSHIHVSVDWDIPTGGAASGEDPYDMTDPWNLTTVSGQSGTITPITQDWFDMATLDDLKTAITSPDVLDAIARTVATRAVPYYDPATGKDTGHGTTLATVLGYNDFQHTLTRTNVPAAVLNQPFTTPAGTSTNLAGILAQIDAKPSGAAAVAAVDVDALAAKLVATLPPAVVSALAAKLSQP